MEKILISACLIGDNTKYDGTNNLKKELLELLDYYELVPFCPEMEGGLKAPRRPSEIRADRVRNDKGEDVTKQFNLGADKAVSLCQYLGINIAILKERSPSCGTHEVYNGLFNGVIVKGKMGITAQRLSMAGVRVMNEDEALEFLKETKANAASIAERKEAAKARREAIEKGEIPAPQARGPLTKDDLHRLQGEKRPFKKDGPYRQKTEKRPFRKDEQGETRRFGPSPKGPKKPFRKPGPAPLQRKPMGKKGDKK